MLAQMGAIGVLGLVGQASTSQVRMVLGSGMGRICDCGWVWQGKRSCRAD